MSQMMPYIHEWDLTWGDVDPAGLIYYPRLLSNVHHGVECLMAEVGHPWDQLVPTDNIGMPLVHVEADYLEAIRYGDSITFEISPTVGETSLTFRTAGKLDGDLACEVKQVHVLVDLEGLAPLSVPDSIRNGLHSFSTEQNA